MICHVSPIPSCPGYFASDTGRIWGPRKELALSVKSGGYLCFSPCLGDGRRTKTAHHAVAEAFLGAKPPGAFVCHRNDVPTDNRVENLYYGNASSNTLDAFRNGGRQARRGEAHGQAKLTWAQVRAIRKRYAAGGVSGPQLGRDYGITHTAIYHVIHHVTWKEETDETRRS